MKKVTFKGYNCVIEKFEYSNGRTALQLTDETDGESVVMATVNIPEYADMASDEVIIKNYSENEGIKEALELQGVIGPAILELESGFVTVTKHKLLCK